jgi:co-chaperonin GroES (HSP10)
MAVAALKQAEYDPKREILDKLGDLSHVEIAQNEVLLAIYQRPEKTAGGIILTAKTRKEDVYQGKVGLVVKIGTACVFKREDPYSGVKFDLPVALHDWVVVRPSDTWALDINGDADGLQFEDFVPCRLIRDAHIRMRVANPEVIW